MPASKRKLAFGASRHVPDEVTCAWGARLIWPDDLVWDRQDAIGGEGDRGELRKWLNGGALKAGLTEARRLATSYELTPREQRRVVLFEDERGIIVADPQSSHGYLYAAAWLK
jgi:hypothetical protein